MDQKNKPPDGSRPSRKNSASRRQGREILDVMTRNTAKALDSGARINVPGVSRVEQYVRVKVRSALEPEDQDALRRAGNGFAADREACQEAGGVGKWLKSSS